MLTIAWLPNTRSQFQLMILGMLLSGYVAAAAYDRHISTN